MKINIMIGETLALLVFSTLMEIDVLQFVAIILFIILYIIKVFLNIKNAFFNNQSLLQQKIIYGIASLGTGIVSYFANKDLQTTGSIISERESGLGTVISFFFLSPIWLAQAVVTVISRYLFIFFLTLFIVYFIAESIRKRKNRV